MRLPFFFSALVVLFVASFSLVDAQEPALSPEVQEAVDKIKSWDGQFTLTPANTIKSIVFADASELDEEALELFAEQTDLETLQISNCRAIDDSVVEIFAGLEKLKSLRLDNGLLSDAGIAMIVRSFPNLVSLDISSNSRISDVSAREIAKLKKLEVLGLLFCNFSDISMMSFATMPKLRAIDIRGNMQISDSGMRLLSKAPALRSLKHRAPISDAGVEALAKIKTLDNLEIQDFIITEKSGEYISQMEKLTSLILFRCGGFKSAGILALKGLKLNRLTMRGLPIDDSAMAALSDLPTIKRLYLHELPAVTDVGMSHLESLKDLEILDIWLLPITGKSLEMIAKLPALKTLSIRETMVTDADLDVLLKMPKLETVTIQGNAQVTAAGLQKLKDAGKFEVK